MRACLRLLQVRPSSEDKALDFTDGTAADATTVLADLNQKSLIDVEEDICYESETEEVGGVGWSGVWGGGGGDGLHRIASARFATQRQRCSAAGEQAAYCIGPAFLPTTTPGRHPLDAVQEDVAAAGAAKKGGLLSSFVRSIGVNIAGTQVCSRAAAAAGGGGGGGQGVLAGHQQAHIHAWGCPGPCRCTAPRRSVPCLLPASPLLLPMLCTACLPSPLPVQALSRADIEPALGGLKKKLMERNVAEEIADK